VEATYVVDADDAEAELCSLELELLPLYVGSTMVEGMPPVDATDDASTVKLADELLTRLVSVELKLLALYVG